MTWVNENDIAIIGMAGRFPGADSLDQFMANLESGKDCISEFSDQELLESGVQESLLGDPRFVKRSGVLEGIDHFDASFFGFSAREAELTDPQQRIFLECAWHALEDAGYGGTTSGGRIAVFAGSSSNTYFSNNLLPSSICTELGNYPVMIGNEKDFLCTRVSFKLNLRGPSLTVQTACSTSLVALHMACQSLLNGEAEIALAGGVSVRSPQKTGYRYQEGGILSSDGTCRPFDHKANGTVIGEGAGVVVIKLLSEALRDRDHIYAVIRATAINNDGNHKMAFTAPSISGQVEVIQEALRVARTPPSTIGYIEAHGTGTLLGDPIEIAALRQVYDLPQEPNKIAVGSLKGNIGHLDAAAGISGLIKVALMLRHRKLLPSIHFEAPNPHLGLEDSSLYINTKTQPWEKGKHPRRASVSAFGLGGTNAYAILEECPESGSRAPQSPGDNTPLLFPFSAKTGDSLQNYLTGFRTFVAGAPELPFGDMAYTLSVGRKAFEHRACVIASHLGELAAALESPLSSGAATAEPSLWLRIGSMEGLHACIQPLRARFSAFQEAFDACHRTILALHPECSWDAAARGGTPLDPVDLRRLDFAVAYALTSLLKRMGAEPEGILDGPLSIPLSQCLREPEALARVMASLGSPGAHPPASDAPAAPPLRGDQKKRLVLTVGEAADPMGDPGEDAIVHLRLLPKSAPAGEAVASFLTLAGQLWVHGLSLRFEPLLAPGPCSRVPLPTYCFDRKRYWIDSPTLPKPSPSAPPEAPGAPKEVPESLPNRTRLQKLLQEVLEADSVQMTDDLFLLGMDSFTTLQLSLEIERVFQVSFPIKHLVEQRTPDKILRLLEQIQAGDSTPARDESIVVFHPGTTKPPVFLIHPAGGTVMGYQHLVRFIPADHPVYGIQYVPRETVGGVRPMEEIALEYIQQIDRLHPKGSVILAGHSFGGNAAFEMAIQMARSGRKVEHLIMFDSHPPRAYFNHEVFEESRFLQAFPIICSMLFTDACEPQKMDTTSLESVIDFLKARNWIPWGFSPEQFRKFYDLWRSNHNTLRLHLPEARYEGSFHFFRASQFQPQAILDALNIELTEGMDLEEWPKLATSPIHFHRVPGTHYNMLDEPQVEAIGRILREVLA